MLSNADFIYSHMQQITFISYKVKIKLGRFYAPAYAIKVQITKPNKDKNEDYIFLQQNYI